MTSLDVDTLEHGTFAEFVRTFAAHWRAGRTALDGFVELLGPDVRLIAPGLRTTRGRRAARAAFQRMFAILPDLTAEVRGWASRGELLFIEMTFTATVGGRSVHWDNVDRFRFCEGVAIERVAYFDPRALQGAFLSRPSGWLPLARLAKSRLWSL